MLTGGEWMADRAATATVTGRFADLLQQVDALIWEADAATFELSFVSRRAVRLLGYPLEAWFAEPEFWLRRLHDDDRAAALVVCRAVAEDGEDRSLEHRMVAASGRMLWFRTEVHRSRESGVSPRLAALMLDITERKQAEAAVKEAEARLREERDLLRAVVDTAGALVLVLDPQGRVLRFNRKSDEVTGMSPEEVMGRPFWETVVEPDDRQQARRAFDQLVTDRKPASGESIWLSRAGGHRRIEWSATVLPQGGGPVTHVVMTGVDVTGRVLAQRELEHSVSLLEAALESTAEGILIIDAGGRVARYNRRFAELCDVHPAVAIVDPAHALDRLLEKLSDPQAFLGKVRELATQPDAETYEVVEFKDGRTFERYSRPQRLSGRAVGRVWSFCDVTGHRRANLERARLLAREQTARQAAESAQRRVEFLYQATTEVLRTPLDVGSRGRVIPQAAVPYLGDWAELDIVEREGAIRCLAVRHADPARTDLARELERVAWIEPDAPEGVPRVLRTGEPAVYSDIDPLRLEPSAESYPPIGTRRLEHLRVVRELGLRSCLVVPLAARGRTIGALSFACAEDPNRYGPREVELAEDLGQRVAMALENAELYEEAQEAVRAREEFLSIASHELRTPVTSLQLAVQSMLRILTSGSLASAPPEFVRNVLKAAERQSRRLEKLVDDLLDVSRITAGRLELRIEDVDLAQIAGDVVGQMRAEAFAAGCPVELESRGPVPGRWDRLRLEQVVTNLLSNAIKYGSGRPVVVSVSAVGSVARLAVCDHGIGIAPERRPHIFDRFERAVSSRDYGGLGLGLYIVRRILQSHGGTVRVESELGLGSTFTVELPRSGAAAASERRGVLA
jgi:PAS domain S-box-containing protein